MYDQPKTCGHCGKSRSDLKRCSQCHVEYYCDKSCQRFNWTDHKLVCRKPDTQKSKKPTTNHCEYCHVPDCSKKCARCKIANYCSKKCQKKDWSRHKTVCRQRKMFYGIEDRDDLTDDERRVLVERWGRHNERIESAKAPKCNAGTLLFVMINKSFPGPHSRWGDVLTPRELSVFKRRPAGSYEKAKDKAKQRFLGWKIIEYFDEVPSEFDRLYGLMNALMKDVLIGFMFMYHNHNIRHGIYLKDAADKITHVEFYLDYYGDFTFPFFSYKQVKPGNYIFIKHPRIHRFADGQIGIRVNDPAEVCICDTDTL